MSQNLNPARLLAELQQFTGDSERYRHSLNRRVIFTPGVKYLADEAGAYWLIDAIASWIGSPEFNRAIAANNWLQYHHFWYLDVELDKHQAVLTARGDEDEPAFITQKIGFTDFPLEQMILYAGFDGTNWVIYLPSEH
ncbi:DUF6876 family protein [Aeoliella sp. SH292]|uniref:DUF6876 family protein n=1 Tax=Aeoliella sp. SH292 TaxID=3454464 RepID=UPI003F955F1B